ncbi:MAG: outer membrane beta-barrel protein [Bacteroidetes bacterium]|nr:outer membrane beta-barrel protein [Bacteroidota bacterium]
MKKILLVFATVWITVSGFAQKTADIGIWGGTSAYFGDMNEVAEFNAFNPNFGAYFRYNFNARVGLRTMILTGTFAEEGLIEGVPWTFNKSVQDLSFQIEINYLKYILGVKNTPFSSYVTFGLGVAYFPYKMDPLLIESFNPDHIKGSEVIEESVIATTLPFGIGFKYNLGRRLGVGVEYQMRKLLSDKFDDLDDPLAILNNENEEVFYTSGVHNMDWSAYLGVHLTYMIYLGKKACPAYESKKK